MATKNPSDRIYLIQSITEKLPPESWEIIDLILQQFDLPTTELWQVGGERRGYIIEMIKGAELQKLHDLAKHLNLETASSTQIGKFDVALVDQVIVDIETQKALMITVATGGPRIQTVNDDYRYRRDLIRSGLESLQISDPIPYPDLWSWHGKWSDGSLPSYSSRRVYVTNLYQPILDQLADYKKAGRLQPAIEPTGWQRVDRSIDKVLLNLAQAQNEKDYQTVGLLCREVIISLAQVVYDPEIHSSLDDTQPSETDAKRMLESYLAASLSGNSNEELRKFAKDAYQLALVLQHKRTASFQLAALCAEATRTLVNVIAIISGQRNP